MKVESLNQEVSTSGFVHERPFRAWNPSHFRGSHVSHTRAQLRRTGRIAIIVSALGMAIAIGVGNPAFATGSATSPQPVSKADANLGGANGQCPGGPYCSTRDGSPSLNGNGNGAAVGKPCAGCVGKADNKNPPGQMPNGSDRNKGYECDSNHGIGRSNPAHTGCAPMVPPKPDPLVVVTSSGVTNCDTRTVTTTTVTTTTGWVLVNNVWVKGAPEVVNNVTTRATTTQECSIVVPPQPVPTETTTTAPPTDTTTSTPPTDTTSTTITTTVEGVEGGGAAVALAGAEANPLPAAASAGRVDTRGQLVAGGFAAFAGFLVLVAGFVLRRRHSDA